MDSDCGAADDIPNYTNLEPTVQISEVKLLATHLFEMPPGVTR